MEMEPRQVCHFMQMFNIKRGIQIALNVLQNILHRCFMRCTCLGFLANHHAAPVTIS